AGGLGRPCPNPPVGAVFACGGRVVGEGFHRRAGAPQAEIEALRAAGGRVRGATLYVTLEPCSHSGRTPPCADALVGLGLRRVVVAMVDPNRRVRGRGIAKLRRAGIPVVVGPGADEARLLTAGYRSHVLRGRPLVTLKLAVTLDGRIAAAGGDSRWTTSPGAGGCRSGRSCGSSGPAASPRSSSRAAARWRRRRCGRAWSTAWCCSWRPPSWAATRWRPWGRSVSAGRATPCGSAASPWRTWG